MIIRCSRSDCNYNFKNICQREEIVIEADASYSGAYCTSVKIKDAPDSPPANQEQKELLFT